MVSHFKLDGAKRQRCYVIICCASRQIQCGVWPMLIWKTDIRHRNKGQSRYFSKENRYVYKIKLTMKIHLIVAGCGESLGIGQEGRLPWRLPQEIKHFAKLTTQQNGTNAVVMGRKTWESIPPKFRPLKNRCANFIIVFLFSGDQYKLLRLELYFSTCKICFRCFNTFVGNM